MNKLMLVFFVLFAFTGISLFEIGSVIITPFDIIAFPSLLIIILRTKIELNKNILFISLIFLLLFASLFNSSDWLLSITTLIHTIYYFIIYFVVLIKVKNISLETFIKINKYIIIIYFCSIIVAMLNSFFFNSEIIDKYFGSVWDAMKMENRYFGFSSEPSYMAIIVSFCMISLTIINKKIEISKYSFVFILFVILIILSRSGYGYIFLIAILLYQYGNYFIKKKIILILLLLPVIYIFISNFLDERFIKILEVIFSKNSFENKLEMWNIADASTYYRIGPTFWMFDNIDLSDVKTYFGHGMGTDREYFLGFGEGYDGAYLNLGLIPVFIYTNGIIPFVFLLKFLVDIFKYINLKVIYILFFIILFNCGIATQLFWFVVSILTILSNIIRNSDNEIELQSD